MTNIFVAPHCPNFYSLELSAYGNAMPTAPLLRWYCQQSQKASNFTGLDNSFRYFWDCGSYDFGGKPDASAFSSDRSVFKV